MDTSRLSHPETAGRTLDLHNLSPSDAAFILTTTTELVALLTEALASGCDDAWGTNPVARALRHAKAAEACIYLSISRSPRYQEDYKTLAAGRD